MNETPVLDRGPQNRLLGRLTSRRGAAFLLAVYFSAMALLVLGGVSLQRTTVEMRAAQISRDTQQAFWLAEGGLDQAIRRASQESLADGTTYPVATSLGSASFTIQTDGASVVSPTTQTVTRTITSTGLMPSGQTARVASTITTTEKLRGVWSKQSIMLWDGHVPYSEPITFKGNLYAGSGQQAAIHLEGVRHEGALQIGPQASVAGWQTLIGNYFNHAGIVLLARGPINNQGPMATITDPHPRVRTMGNIPAPAAPYSAAQCAGSITIVQNQVVEIHDGDPRDLTPAGDGKVEICVQYINGEYDPRINGGLGAAPRLLLRQPTTIYVVGENGGGYAVMLRDLLVIPEVAAASPTTAQIPNGARFIVQRPTTGLFAPGSPLALLFGIDPKTGVRLITNRFSGSIYAPDSTIDVGNFSADVSPDSEELGYLVGDSVNFAVIAPYASESFDLQSAGGGNGTTVPTTSSILSWGQGQ